MSDYLINELQRLRDLKRRTTNDEDKQKIQLKIDMIEYEIKKVNKC